jgi:hypothetical protein
VGNEGLEFWNGFGFGVAFEGFPAGSRRYLGEIQERAGPFGKFRINKPGPYKSKRRAGATKERKRRA